MDKKNEKKEGWFRIIVLIVSGIILSIWANLIGILIIVNFLITIVSGKRNKDIALFCEYWNTEMYRFSRYVTFTTNERPFPFTNMKKIGKFE